MIRVLSLGAGVQSTAVLLMSCKGALPKLDAAVFADTQWEPAAVYHHLEWLEIEAGRHGIPVHRVSAGNIREDALNFQVRGRQDGGRRWASMPYFTKTDGPGKGGQIRRQCTGEYKIQPIERFIRRELLGLQPGERAPIGSVEQWFGISADEVRRARMSQVSWKVHFYPLIGLPGPIIEKPFTRDRCMAWLAEHYPERHVPRSACLGCPYHSKNEWKNLKINDPRGWGDVVEFDRAIRTCAGMRDEMFLHSDRIPLDKVDLRSAEDFGQQNLWNTECEGMCGV